MGYFMSDGSIVMECQHCSTRYKVFSLEETKSCNTCGSDIQTIKYGRMSIESRKQYSSLTIKPRKGNPSMARPKIVKMPEADSKKSKKTTKNPVGRRFKGKSSGTGVLAFQNKSLTDNRRAKETDKVIAKAWRDEFPNAKSYTEKDVASVRRAFNRGKHGNEAPSRPLVAFDHNGDPIKKEKAVVKKANKTTKKVSKKKTTKASDRQLRDDDDDDEDDDEDDFHGTTEDDEEEG
jgi:hypothetical protein